MKRTKFEDFLAPLKTCSLNRISGRPLVDHDKVVVNFDEVKKQYCKNVRIGEISSVDAFDKKGEKLLFIEFKDSRTGKTKKIFEKAYDSALTYCDVASVFPQEIKKNGVLVVVYKEKLVEEQRSFQTINRAIHSYANKKPILFDLEPLGNFPFSEVFTITPAEFIDEYCN